MEYVTKVSPTDWYRIVDDAPEATFFHSPLWAELVTQAYPRIEAKAYGWTVSGELDGVIPVFADSNEVAVSGVPFRLPVLTSSFNGTYGGPVSRSGRSPSLREFVQQTGISGAFARFSVHLNPLDDGSVRTDGDFDVTEDFTQILSLDRSFDEILAGYSDGRRRAVAAARDAGVTVREAESKADFRAYYGAYQDSLVRWDDVDKVYPWDLFDAAAELSAERPERVKLWLAEVDDEVASGALVFYWNDHAVYWHGAGDEEFFDARPNDLLHTEIVRDCIERGYRYYDFNPSGGHEGVVRFKAGFGPERVPVRRVNVEGRVTRVLHRLYDEYGERLPVTID